MLQEKPNDSCGFSDHFLNQSNYKSDPTNENRSYYTSKNPKNGV